MRVVRAPSAGSSSRHALKTWSALLHRQQLGKVVALALVFCVAIVLSNVSLRIIPVSFNQVTYPCWVGPIPRSTKVPAQRCLKRSPEEYARCLPYCILSVCCPHHHAQCHVI